MVFILSLFASSVKKEDLTIFSLKKVCSPADLFDADDGA